MSTAPDFLVSLFGQNFAYHYATGGTLMHVFVWFLVVAGGLAALALTTMVFEIVFRLLTGQRPLIPPRGGWK